MCSHRYMAPITRARASTNLELRFRMAGVIASRTPLPAISRRTASRISCTIAMPLKMAPPTK